MIRRGLKMARVGIWRSHKNACHLYASLLASWCLYVYGIGICVNFLKHACCWFLEWLPILRENRTSFVCSLILVEACANHPMCVRTRNLAYTPPVTNSEHAWAWKRSAGAARMVMVLCATVAAKVFLLLNCCWQEASSRSLKFLFLIRLLFRLNFGRQAWSLLQTRLFRGWRVS